MPNRESAIEWAVLEIEKKPALIDSSTGLQSKVRRQYKVKLDEANEIVRAAIEQYEAALPSPSVEEVLAILHEETSKRRKRTKCLVIGLGFYVGLMVLVFAVSMIRHSHIDFTTFSSFTAFTGLAAGATSQHKKAARMAARMKNREALGPLLELLNAGDPVLVATTKEAVTGIFERIGPDETYELEQEALTNLYRAMSTANEEPFREAVAYALGHVGNTTSISFLESLIKNPGKVSPAAQERIKNRAQMSLGDLRLRLARNVVVSHSESAQAEQQLVHLRIGDQPE